jgi:hypothetical protein
MHVKATALWLIFFAFTSKQMHMPHGRLPKWQGAADGAHACKECSGACARMLAAAALLVNITGIEYFAHADEVEQICFVENRQQNPVREGPSRSDPM